MNVINESKSRSLIQQLEPSTPIWMNKQTSVLETVVSKIIKCFDCRLFETWFICRKSIFTMWEHKINKQNYVAW